MRFSRGLRGSFVAALTGLVVVLAGAGVAYAANENLVTSGITNKSIFKFGNNINITGTVNGDIICAGQTVTIDATVNGDIICAAQTITVTGKVSGDIRVAGQTVNVNSDLSRNASIAGQDVTISKEAKVGRDLQIAGETLNIDGAVGRDLSVESGKTYINNTIGRNANVNAAEKLILQDSATINGNLKYSSPVKLVKTGSANVEGTTTYTKIDSDKTASRDWLVIWQLYVLLGLTLVSVVLVTLFPQAFRRLSDIAGKKLGWAFLTGFVAMFAVPIVIFSFFISLIGIPFALILILLWILALVITFPLAFYIVGARVLPKLHPVLMILIISLVIGVIQILPFIGGLITFALYLLGSGTLLLGLKEAYKRPDYSRK